VVSRSPDAARRPDSRRSRAEYADLDLVCAHRAGQVLTKCLDGLGYQPDKPLQRGPTAVTACISSTR